MYRSMVQQDIISKYIIKFMVVIAIMIGTLTAILVQIDQALKEVASWLLAYPLR